MAVATLFFTALFAYWYVADRSPPLTFIRGETAVYDWGVEVCWISDWHRRDCGFSSERWIALEGHGRTRLGESGHYKVDRTDRPPHCVPYPWPANAAELAGAVARIEVMLTFQCNPVQRLGNFAEIRPQVPEWSEWFTVPDDARWVGPGARDLGPATGLEPATP